ncbi:MAG: hypothetical protein LBH99_04465 [Rickettsia sp.]|jgi:hypothetical protein|nr:hypothetical protein [Rickettsia sp.]
MDAEFCVYTLYTPLTQQRLKTFNGDQGLQFSSSDVIKTLINKGTEISMGY